MGGPFRQGGAANGYFDKLPYEVIGHRDRCLIMCRCSLMHQGPNGPDFLNQYLFIHLYFSHLMWCSALLVGS